MSNKICINCQKEFASKQSLNNHLKKHCNYIKINKDELNTNKKNNIITCKSITEEFNNVCIHCNKIMSSIYCLERHYNSCKVLKNLNDINLKYTENLIKNEHLTKENNKLQKEIENLKSSINVFQYIEKQLEEEKLKNSRL